MGLALMPSYGSRILYPHCPMTIDQSRKDCLGSKGGMSTESTLYNTYMALPDQYAAQDVFDSSRVNARVSTRFSR